MAPTLTGCAWRSPGPACEDVVTVRTGRRACPASIASRRRWGGWRMAEGSASPDRSRCPTNGCEPFLLSRDQRRGQAGELLWANFAEHPSLDCYRALRDAMAEDFPAWRDRALALLRSQPSAKTPWQPGRSGTGRDPSVRRRHRRRLAGRSRRRLLGGTVATAGLCPGHRTPR